MKPYGVSLDGSWLQRVPVYSEQRLDSGQGSLWVLGF